MPMDGAESPPEQPEDAAESELFRLIAEYTYDWETWVDARGKARWVNSAVERITGMGAAACLADPAYPLSLVYPNDRSLVAQALREAALGKSGNDVEFRVLRADGSAAWVAMSWQPVRGTAGDNLGYRTSVRDIDARKRMEDELHAMRRRAERALRARSALLANVSHELRSPVHCIAGFAELLSETPLESEQRHYVELIHDQCQSMLHQVEDLLGLAALEADGVRLKRAPFDAALLVQRIVAACEPRARAKALALRVETPLSHPFRMGDALRLRQVVRNVVDNALKFTDSGSVQVRLFEDEGESLVCTVADTGPGIAAEDVGRMFDPFVQGDDATTRRHGGVGLGLSIAQRLLHAMHGVLSVESAPGRGTTVTIRLPLQRATSVPAQGEETRRHGHFPVRVLVVDDSAPARELLAAMLRRFGAHAVCSVSGADAKRLASEQAVDLVLLDYQMPDMDGAETAVALRRIFDAREDTRGIPIYLLTANVFVRDELGARSAAFDGIVEKPLAQADLERLLSELPKAQAGRARHAEGAIPFADDTLLDLTVVADLAQTEGRDGASLLLRFAPRVLGEVAAALAGFARLGQGLPPQAAVHALVGNALSIGARSLALALREAEALVQAGEPAAFEAAIARSEALYVATCAAYRARGVAC